MKQKTKMNEKDIIDAVNARDENFETRIIEEPDIEIRAGDDEKLPVIHGYAALFNRVTKLFDGLKEVILPGAFTDVLNNDVRATVNHEGGLTTLGRTKNGTLRLEQDDKGLRFEIDPPDTQAGRDITELVRRKDISQASFAFSLNRKDVKITEDDKGNVLREIKKINRLRDVSLVNYPAYADTKVAVRSLEDYRKEHKESDNRGIYEERQKLLEQPT